MDYNHKLKAIMEYEERNAVWLSKKLSCSHTLVYNWLKGITEVSEKYKVKITGLFGKQYGI